MDNEEKPARASFIARLFPRRRVEARASQPPAVAADTTATKPVARDDAHLAAAYRDRPADMIVRLDAPFEWEGRSIDEIELHEPALGDIEAVMKGQLSQLELFARMSGVPAAALKAMRWSDSSRFYACAGRLAPEMRRV